MKAESNTYRILCILSIVALVLLSGCFDNGPLSEYQDEHIKVTTYKENDELLIEVQAHSGEYSNIVIVAKPELSGDVKDNVDGEPVVEIHKSSQGFLGAINNVDPVVELYDKAWTVALKDPKVDGYIAWDDSEEIATFSSVKNALDDLYPNPSESMKPLKGFAIMIDSAATKIMNGLGSGTRTVPLGPGDKVIFRYTLLPGYNLKSNDEYKIDYEAINTNNLLDIDVTLTDPHGIESPTQKKLGEYFKNDMLPKSGQWAVEMENCIGEITISNVTIQEKNCHNDYDLTTTQIYYAIWMQKDKEDGSENTFFAKDLEPPLTTLIAESFTHGSAEGSLKKTGIGQSAVSGSSLAVAGIKLSSVAGGASMEAAAEIPLDKIIESDISDSGELWFKARLLDTDEVFISMSSDSAEDDLDLIVYDLEGNVLKSSNVPAGYREEGFIITSSDQIYIKVEKFSASNGKFYLVVMGEPVYTEPVIQSQELSLNWGLILRTPLILLFWI
ncbi:MAG: hypothetical protein L6243_06560 [Candidatus Altiarchaeales archaeon]|nr:hypothetical protein [Candidatus Altiarchaeales archaeon]